MKKRKQGLPAVALMWLCWCHSTESDLIRPSFTARLIATPGPALMSSTRSVALQLDALRNVAMSRYEPAEP